MMQQGKISQAGLALMGFSQHCPSSMDLTNFEVCGHGGATVELSRRMRWLSLADSLESGNLEIRESGNLESRYPETWIIKSRIGALPHRQQARRAQVSPGIETHSLDLNLQVLIGILEF